MEQDWTTDVRPDVNEELTGKMKPPTPDQVEKLVFSFYSPCFYDKLYAQE